MKSGNDNSFATGAVLIKTEISSFCLYQERITPHNLLMGVMTTSMGTMSVPSGTLCLTLEVVNGDLVFGRK